MPQLSDHTKTQFRRILIFLRWLLYAILIGIVVGGVAVAFHLGIDWGTELRTEHPRMIFLLPAGGAFIVLLYRVCGMEKDRGTNRVLVAVRSSEPLKLRTAPLIFLSTVVTHLVGGSAGREGAALQLGGSLAGWIGRQDKMNEDDHRIMVMCGMAAAFSALFGTPITAALFSMEVTTVGLMYYAAFVPCFTSSLSALLVARAFGLHSSPGYQIGEVSALSSRSLIQVILLGMLCALISMLFCETMHRVPHLYEKYLSDSLARVLVGALLVLGLTLLAGNQDYNGAGDPVIRRMLAGETIPQAFLMKLLFTALTLGAGFRGGEIVPVLFTGCAFGTLAGPMFGLPHGFSGALGMAAMFCGCTNCPLSSILLSVELFGQEGLPLYALCCGVSYMLSGYYSLYNEQKIAYSKFRMAWVDRKTH